jgi:hypothetical protein
MGASAVCLHNQNACTNHTVTHSAGPRHPLPGGAETGAVASFRPRKSPMASHQRETRTERLRTFDRSRAPVAGRCPCRSSSFPRKRGETSKKRCALCAKPLLAESPGHGMLQRQRTLAVAFGLERTCGNTCDPATEAVAARADTTQHQCSSTIARRNSTCDSPKTRRPSEPERLLGHLRLDSPAKVGRLAAVTTPFGAAFARRANHEHLVSGVPSPKHRAGELGRGGLLAKSPLRGLPGRHVKSLPLARHAARRGLTSRPMVEARSHWRAPLLLLLPIAR